MFIFCFFHAAKVLFYSLFSIWGIAVALEVEDKTGCTISPQTIKRFYSKQISSISKNKAKGVLAMYVMSIHKTNATHDDTDSYYTDFIQSVTLDFKKAPNFNNIKLLNNLKGCYESYILVNSSQEGSCVRKSIFELQDNGRAFCKSSSMLEYEGNIEIRLFGRLIILSMQMQKGEQLTNCFFYIILQGSYDEKIKRLSGIYGGVDVHNNPMCGREVFIKVEDGMYADLKPSLISINSEEFKNLIIEKPFLKDFFLGKKDSFSETIELLKLIENT